MTELLSAHAITKRYPGVTALDGVDFTIGRGEVHALLGHNGAGKSTLIKILTGDLRPDEGRITMDGERVDLNSPADALRAGIRVVTQERNLIPALSVEENIMLGDLPGSRVGLIDWRSNRIRALEGLLKVGVDVNPSALVATLRPSEQALVEIARSLSHEARVLVLDEPTSSISESESQRLFSVIRELRRAGVGNPVRFAPSR